MKYPNSSDQFWLAKAAFQLSELGCSSVTLLIGKRRNFWRVKDTERRLSGKL